MKTGNLRDRYPWNVPGMVDDLEAWWAEDYPCSLIAEKLREKYGGTPTRNAVIGKVRRLLLAMRGKRPPGKPRAAPKLKIDGKLPRTTPFCLKPNDGHEKTISGLNPREIPLEQRKQLLDLKEHHCRFPYGDVGKPGFFFCGDEKVSGCSYCSFHYRVTRSMPRKISRAEFERNRILGLRATERLRVKRGASA